ncbi:hypothetical protein INQ51_08915 [Maribellus sp. CM-23]|uniref:hypothetical protein n=1 Tax=Maribellus sp. CM-23 TaxID=2781026 RepID=UPI001F1B2D06|nr:hypothetical protein [Maribellus sp. CM-23]MCE4564429.1 hypothetical protein [Maribellus sp. CM-23]
MWKAMIYKEWLKIRWFTILYALLGMLAVGYLFLKVQHDTTFNQPNNYWNLILFKGLKFFSPLKFIPLAGGLLVAVAQYFPETVNKRIKLTFHLPFNENKVLLCMMGFGSCCLLAVYLILITLFSGIAAFYFPSNIILPALVSLIPWFLAGFSTYYLVALIVLEPVWKFRFLYLLVAATFIPLFFINGSTAAYQPVNITLAVLTVLLSISLLFSGYRFRKGEM